MQYKEISLEFKDSATKKARNVYLDADLQIPLAQPVTPDADGMWPPIFLEHFGNDYDVDVYSGGRLFYKVESLRNSNRQGFWWRY